MNIKELVYKISYKKVFNEIYKYYLQNRSDDSVTELDSCMYLAWNNLSKTEYKKSDDEEVEGCKIALMQVEQNEEQCIEEEYIDVCLHNETKNESFAIDFLPWEHLMQKQIINPLGLNKEQVMAHILWELTFWGYSSEKVVKAGESIMEDSDESI